MENMYGIYDYKASEMEDVEDFIDTYIDLSEYDSLEELGEKLNDELWDEDSVTGNGSGSYTMSRAKACEYLSGNFDLLADALDEFGGGTDVIRQGEEACDIAIRCYFLYDCIHDVLEEKKDEFEEAHKGNNKEEEEE